MANLANRQAVDFRYILLDDYKKLGISEDQMLVVLMVDHLTRQGNAFVTADLLRLKMNYKTDQIDKILSSLVKKGWLAYESDPNGGLRTSLEPLKTKLYKQFEADLAKEAVNLHSATRAESLNRLYAYVEKRFNRTLSPLENEQINAWLDEGFGENEIVDAVEEALGKGRKTFKSVDKAIRSSRKRDDIAKEGYSAVDERWSKTIEESYEIANVKWVDNED